LTGAVPKKNGKPIDSSGVTVATGFDVGQHSVHDLKSMGLSQTIIDKLTPYTQKKGDDADEANRKQPLSLTQDEADQIDAADKKAKLNGVRRLYDKATAAHGTKFDDLSSDQQTVIASVAFQ